jgi:hypothetical protein
VVLYTGGCSEETSRHFSQKDARDLSLVSSFCFMILGPEYPLFVWFLPLNL